MARVVSIAKVDCREIGSALLNSTRLGDDFKAEKERQALSDEEGTTADGEEYEQGPHELVDGVWGVAYVVQSMDLGVD